MSRPIFPGSGREYATEQELLDFANKIREAGGADVLEALMPSKPGDAEACLIANALNFGCSVRPVRGHLPTYEDGSSPWVMEIGGDEDKLRELGEALDLPIVTITRSRFNYSTYLDEYYDVDVLALPKHIGNAAEAFDSGLGWTREYSPED